MELVEVSRRRRAAAALGSLAWLAALVAYQLETGGRLVVVPGLALAPLLASLVLEWRATGGVALATIGAVVLLSGHAGSVTSNDTVLRVGGSAATAGFAVLNSAVRRHRERRLARLARVAEVAQAEILHAVPPQVGGVRVASRYVSASRDALVGGDLYDAVDTSRGVRVLLGDVRGKGLPAVHLAAHALSAFRALAPRVELRLVDVAAALERALEPELGEEDFVTVVLCELGPLGALEVVNCGHPSPLLLRPDGEARELEATRPSPPLGCGARPYGDRHVLAPGDRVLLFTDGLCEARDARGRFFDVPGTAVALPRSDDLQAAVDALVTAAAAHVGGSLDDDLAVLLLEPAPAPHRPDGAAT